MLLGVPKEIKTHEYRVGMTPATVREMIANHGHQVVVEHNAGAGIGFTDEHYQAVGASIAPDASTIFKTAEMIVKVKEPQANECKMLRDGQILFTYLHLAADPLQAKLLAESGSVAIAYETVTGHHNSLPLLMPMSQVAGRMSIQAGAHCLEKAQGGNGIMLGGVPGVAPANVLVIGGGVVGANAVRMAMGMEARVTVVDKSLYRLRELNIEFGGQLNTIHANVDTIEHYAYEADLVVGAVLVPGGAAPKLITRDMLKGMQDGSVLVDVSIDQGGCFETSSPTTHAEPTFVVDGVVHYCVTNMPGAVPRTATVALNNATLPFIIQLANKGYKRALLENPDLMNGLNVHRGKITYEAVANDLEMAYHDPIGAVQEA